MKKIIITGASDGIGLEIAKVLASEGNQLLLVSRSEEKLLKVMEILPGTGHDVKVADLSKKEDIHNVAELLSQTHYDMLINCAGIGMYGRFEEMPLHEQVNMLHVNIYGLTVLSYHYIRNSKKGDSLVNISSTLGTSSFPGLAVYAATKAYVLNLSESLWWENRKRGVYVLGFCPGVTKTKFHKNSGGSNDFFPEYISQIPEQVATELTRALSKRKKPKVVSGAMNRFMLFFQRFLSRKMVVEMMGIFSPLKKQLSETK